MGRKPLVSLALCTVCDERIYIASDGTWKLWLKAKGGGGCFGKLRYHPNPEVDDPRTRQRKRLPLDLIGEWDEPRVHVPSSSAKDSIATLDPRPTCSVCDHPLTLCVCPAVDSTPLAAPVLDQ